MIENIAYIFEQFGTFVPKCQIVLIHRMYINKYIYIYNFSNTDTHIYVYLYLNLIFDFFILKIYKIVEY